MEQAAAEPAAAAPTGAKTVGWETGHERSPSNGRGGAAKKKGGEKGKQPRKHKPPSTEAAMRYRNITCPRELTTQGYRPYSVLKFQDDRFRRFGVGVMLYFKLLRRLQRQFMVMVGPRFASRRVLQRSPRRPARRPSLRCQRCSSTRARRG